MADVPDFRTTTVEALAASVRAGELTARALTDAALERIDAHDGVLNAFVAVDGEAAQSQADAIDARIAAGEDVGPLAGIPIGIKDLEDAAGFRTTRGAAHLADSPVLDHDSTEVARLKAAGCVVIGKTNTPEFGFVGDTYNPTFGATRNPWSTERSPGGSSGGTSAAVAGGLVPLATGSDGGGSIRIPSAVCAMSGFKPSQGRIPHGPAPMGAADLSTVGPMARRIRDVAAALDVVVGPSPDDLRSLPHPATSFRAACDAPAAPARLLYCPSVDGSVIDDEIAAVTMAAVDELRAAGIEIVEIDALLPEVFSPFLLLFFGGMVPAYRPLMGTAAFDAVTPDLQRILLMADERLTPDSVEEARKAAQANSIVLADAMAGFDALITPTVIGHTPISQRGGTINGEEVLGWVGNTFGFNVTRRPAGTTPIGLTGDGMPLGLQIVGHQLDDIRTLELTAWCEDLFGHDLVAPFPS
jgi:aspartyl-tRNA(Asn)/glutamyl-tRNA(Gln) amidotransferase subunit A